MRNNRPTNSQLKLIKGLKEPLNNQLNSNKNDDYIDSDHELPSELVEFMNLEKSMGLVDEEFENLLKKMNNAKDEKEANDLFNECLNYMKKTL